MMNESMVHSSHGMVQIDQSMSFQSRKEQYTAEKIRSVRDSVKSIKNSAQKASNAHYQREQSLEKIVGQKERKFVGESLCVTVGCWTAGKGHRQTQTETQA